MKKWTLFTAGVIALMLVAFIVAGSTAASAQRGSTQSKCEPRAQNCPEVPSVGGTITSINGATVTVQSKDRTATIHLTASTTYQKFTPAPKQFSPASQADLAVGEVIEAQGTLNSDGALTATTVTFTVTG